MPTFQEQGPQEYHLHYYINSDIRTPDGSFLENQVVCIFQVIITADSHQDAVEYAEANKPGAGFWIGKNSVQCAVTRLSDHIEEMRAAKDELEHLTCEATTEEDGNKAVDDDTGAKLAEAQPIQRILLATARLIEAARLIKGRWEHGDLAGAVRGLVKAMEEAEDALDERTKLAQTGELSAGLAHALDLAGVEIEVPDDGGGVSTSINKSKEAVHAQT